jgi:hypothetical protein
MGLYVVSINGKPVTIRHVAAVLGSQSPPGWVSAPTYNTVPYTPPSGKTVTVSGQTATAVDDAFIKALAGDLVYFPAGVYPHANGKVFPDGVYVAGAGIYDQGGGGGSWLKFSFYPGSHIAVSNLLAGQNTAGISTIFRPVARGTAYAGSDTNTNGSHDVTFNFVRLKGGSDTGYGLLELSANYTNSWSAALKKYDMVGWTFNDCEFERPQSTNAVNNANGAHLGRVVDLWFDQRLHGAQIHDVAWNRCHFGVQNGYHGSASINGYGCGDAWLIQPSPSASDGTGPTMAGGSVITGANWNSHFDWSLVEHGAYNLSLTDCLLEYATWYPMDICDSSRPYSCWHGVQAGYSDGGGSHGWGNPPGSHWTDIPTANWTDYIALTRCLHKGILTGGKNAVYEIGRHATVLNSGGGYANHAGSYGNTVSGAFSNANRPHTAIFTVDWSSSAYTPSPYDPA